MTLQLMVLATRRLMEKNVTVGNHGPGSAGTTEKPGSLSQGFLAGDLAVFFLLFFLSGACALIYEITWTRRLTLIFGNTVYSVSTVLVAFMGGLALGSIWFGGLVDKSRNHIRIYGFLEIGIGVSALLVPLVLGALDPGYRILYREIGSSPYWMSIARFVLSTAVLIVPTTMMGATLPVLSKVIVRRIEQRGLGIGTLYSINTLGAMTGCFLAGFVLLGWLGITPSERAAAVMNICIGLIAFSLQERLGPISPFEGAKAEPISAEPIEHRYILRLVLLVLGVSGMLALAYEVLWTRILVFLLGSSIYSFSMILVVYLFGLTAGSLLSARLVDKSKRPLLAFGWLEVLIGVTAFGGFLLFRYLPFEEYVLTAEPFEYLARNFLCTVAIVLPPTLLMGATFPVAVRVYARSLGRLGKQTGTLYAVNTIGAVVGSFAAGFVLIPLLGSKNSLMLLVLLSLAVGILLLYLSMKSEGAPNLNWLAGALVALPMAGFPVGNDLMEELSMRFLEGLPGKVVAMNEDATAAVAVVELPNKFRFLAVNGVVMTLLCTETQLMAHLPVALSSEPPRNLLTICFGMGSTFVSARRVGLDVDFVELCPYVVDVFKYFQHDESLLNQPGVGKIIADGRNYVLLTDKRYDIIVVDPPPPPWSAGTVNLYTQEFYELCKARLTKGGIMLQWLPTVRDCFTEPQFKMMLRTFLEVFPHTTVWRSPNDYGVFLVGTPERLSVDRKSFLAYFARPAVKSDLALYSTTPITGRDVLSYLALDEEHAWNYAGDAPVMNDDNPWIEFPLFKAGPTVTIMKPDLLASGE
ncbi:MAG: hypothetical protein Kow0099_05450 [Candidatus Abyssubacteria bacterium]